MVNPTGIAGNTEEEEEVEVPATKLLQGTNLGMSNTSLDLTYPLNIYR